MSNSAKSPVYGNEADRNNANTLGVVRREVLRLIALREDDLEHAKDRNDRSYVQFRKGQLDALHTIRRMIPERGQP